MPRVTRHKKSRGGKTLEYNCQRCQEGIKPGEEYYEWSFRYGGTQRQHVKHGNPRASQLTQGKLGVLYAQAENLEDWHPIFAYEGDQPTEEDLQTIVDEAVSALQEARDEADGVMQEYEDAIEAMPASEEQNRERIEAIEEWISELEDAESNVESIDFHEAFADVDPGAFTMDAAKTILQDAAATVSF